MQYYTEDRMRRQSNPGGRFTNTRGPDPNAIRAQQLIEAQYMAQQQQQQIRPVGGTIPRGARRMTGGTPNDAYMDMERMKRTVKGLQEQLALADDTIRKLKSKEKDLGDRVTQDIQNQVQLSGRFEDLSKGGTRPTQIIERYGLLYTQGRIDAMDDLDQIAGLSKYGKHQEMKQKILYGIMVASYKVSYDYLHQLKLNVRRILGVPDKHPATEKDAFASAITFLTTYFQSTTQTFNVEPVVRDVQDQLVQLLPEFPSLSRLPGIASYTTDCCRVAWSMVNQIPPMELEHSHDKFSQTMHTRFHASSDKNNKIKMYVWPTLVDSGSKNVLYKGVVWT